MKKALEGCFSYLTNGCYSVAVITKCYNRKSYVSSFNCCFLLERFKKENVGPTVENLAQSAANDLIWYEVRSIPAKSCT